MTHPRAFIRALTGLSLLTAVLAASLVPVSPSVKAAPQAQSLSHVVISEFRTSEPSRPNDEFIELYNATTNQVDISGWKINASDDAGAVSTKATIPAVPVHTFLESGQHYLIANDNPLGGYSGKQPDLTYTLGIQDDGGIALLDAAGKIVDEVGMSTTSAYKEPDNSGILTPLPGITPAAQSYERLLGGTSDSCIDTDNNANDFTPIATSDPQNTQSPLSLCGTILSTLTPSSTPTVTSTPTRTRTPTPTRSPAVDCALTPTPSAYSSLALLINEVGWSGTIASSADQWVEIYNPGPCPVNLSGWRLQGQISGSIKFNIGLADSLDPVDSISSNSYFVLAENSNVFTQNVLINQVSSSLNLLNTTSTPGESLLLFGPANELVDHANINGNSWPAGSASTRASMERSGVVQDVRTSWVTYAGPTTNIKDSGGNFVRGTPGRANWAYSVTITPSPFYTATKKPTPRPPTPFAHVVINEFLPRPGFDWNNDGAINVYDEFIEIENLGPIDVNLGGWKLDNVSAGSHFYTLPAKTLKSGDRALYYGSVTKIPLFDSGGTVRLINSRGVVVDARGYGVIKDADQSHCRIPDGDGYWRFPCFPTPGTENVLTGSLPVLPPVVASHPPACLLADTVPDAFRQAVCSAFGEDIVNGGYWNELAGEELFPVQDIYNKSLTIIQ